MITEVTPARTVEEAMKEALYSAKKKLQTLEKEYETCKYDCKRIESAYMAWTGKATLKGRKKKEEQQAEETPQPEEVN